MNNGHHQNQHDENTSLLSSLEDGRQNGSNNHHNGHKTCYNGKNGFSTLQQYHQQPFSLRHSLKLLAVAAVVVGVCFAGGLLWERRAGSDSNQQQPQMPQESLHDAYYDNTHPNNQPSKYSNVQFFGFQIYTGGAPAFLEETVEMDDEDDTTHTNNITKTKTVITANPECMGLHSYGETVLDVDPVLLCYLGHHDPLKDVDIRLNIMRDAVEAAYQQSLENSNDTLKIFVAPEFYWRGRKQGAYEFVSLDKDVFSDDTCNGPICAILRGLEDIVQDERYKDWFFVFGTIIAAQHLPAEDDYYQHLFYNFAPIYKGFDPSSSSDNIDSTKPLGKRFLLPKRYVSDSDFLRQPNIDKDRDLKRGWAELLGADNQPNTTNDLFYEKGLRYDDHLFEEYKLALFDDAGYVMIEYDWLIIDGVTMTTEICFDHQKKTALNTYLGDMIKGRPTRIPKSSDENGLEYVPIPIHQAQLGVVSSAGMTITADSMAVMEDGVVFLQDGLSDEKSYQYIDYDMWNTCDQGIQFEGGTECVRRQSIVSNTDVNFMYQVLDPIQKIPVYDESEWKEKLKNTFTTAKYPPHVVAHEPIPLVQPYIHARR